jgi:hypothetical protein
MAQHDSSMSAGVSWGIALLLAIAHWVVAVLASRHNAVTFDEVAHVAGGMAQVLLACNSLTPSLCHVMSHCNAETSRHLAKSPDYLCKPKEAYEITGKT